MSVLSHQFIFRRSALVGAVIFGGAAVCITAVFIIPIPPPLGVALKVALAAALLFYFARAFIRYALLAGDDAVHGILFRRAAKPPAAMASGRDPAAMGDSDDKDAGETGGSFLSTLFSPAGGDRPRFGIEVALLAQDGSSRDSGQIVYRFISPILSTIIINGRQRQYTIVLMPDSLPEDAYRQLRVRLQTIIV